MTYDESNMNQGDQGAPAVERQAMDMDIACVGFGPAMGGFLTTLTRQMVDESGQPKVESRVMPGMPPQVICYERADDIGFGVSGVVSRARAIRQSFPDLEQQGVPMMTPVKEERVLYLLDPIGASRRPPLMRAADRMIRAFGWMLPCERHAFRLPYTPPFLRKHGGLIMSIGQFNQWVGQQLMMSGQAQIWPATPVEQARFDDGRVAGIRLVDQGTDRAGNPDAGYMPGMDINSRLTVVGDGPVGPVGRQIDERLGLPEGNHRREWAVGMKFVVDLPEDCELKAGTVLHTFGYPEPEIFGFLYVHPENVASLGIFLPSWFDNPVRSTYRYLQHWMQHPYLWRYLEGGTLRSYGAKTLFESGRRGEPHLAGDGFARIGEGSGSTNVLTGSGVDEAWATGQMLAEGVLDLLREGREFTKENLDAAYVQRRRNSWVEKEARVAEHARDGFTKGFIRGMIGMGLAGMSGGRLWLGGDPKPPHQRIPTLEDHFRGKISPAESAQHRADCEREGKPLHDALMEAAGWPAIPFDGQLLISQQDALLTGGKVQAPAGYRDHVVFLDPEACEQCGRKVCIELCSGQAIAPNPGGGAPTFDREKCLHCGACLWNCAVAHPDDPERTAIDFRAGAGGLHSAEN